MFAKGFKTESLKEAHYNQETGEVEPDWFYGVDGVEYIWHGEYADPEVWYKGELFNYYDLEDWLYSDFIETTGSKDSDEFAKWVKNNPNNVYSALASLSPIDAEDEFEVPWGGKEKREVPWGSKNESLKEGYYGETLYDFFECCIEPSAIDKVQLWRDDIVYEGSYDDIPEELLDAEFIEFDTNDKLVINVDSTEGYGYGTYEFLNDFLEDCNSDIIEVFDLGTEETIYSGYKDECPDEILEMAFESFDSPSQIACNIEYEDDDLDESKKPLSNRQIDAIVRRNLRYLDHINKTDDNKETSKKERPTEKETKSIKEEYGSYEGRDFCLDISDQLEEGDYFGTVTVPEVWESVDWVLEISGYKGEDFHSTELIDMLTSDIYYPVRDGHLWYDGLDEYITRDIVEDADLDDLKHDFEMLGYGEDFEEWLNTDEEGFEFWVDYDTNFDVDLYDEIASRADEEDLTTKIEEVLDEYGLTYGDVVDYISNKTIRIVGCDPEEYDEVASALYDELGLEANIPSGEEGDDEITVLYESLKEDTKRDLYVNGKYVASSNKYKSNKDFANKVKKDGKVTTPSVDGKVPAGLERYSKTVEIKPEDKVRVRKSVKEDKEKKASETLWTNVCSNRINAVKKYFENGGKTNLRYNRFDKDNSLIMGALRNGNTEMVELLKSYGETILPSEKQEYKLEVKRQGLKEKGE